MVMKKMALAAAVSLSMASAPVMAQSQAPTQAVAIERAGAPLDEANDQRGRFPFLIVFVVIAIGIGLYFAIDGGRGNRPTSP